MRSILQIGEGTSWIQQIWAFFGRPIKTFCGLHFVDDLSLLDPERVINDILTNLPVNGMKKNHVCKCHFHVYVWFVLRQTTTHRLKPQFQFLIWYYHSTYCYACHFRCLIKCWSESYKMSRPANIHFGRPQDVCSERPSDIYGTFVLDFHRTFKFDVTWLSK